MEDFVKVANVDEIPAGGMRTFIIGGKRIAVAHTDDRFFAVDDTCTHEECSLGTEGFLDATTVICGCHGAQFDVTTGRVQSLPATSDLGSYEVKAENGEIYVKIPSGVGAEQL